MSECGAALLERDRELTIFEGLSIWRIVSLSFSFALHNGILS
jgi:hypothetical protein